MVIQWASSSAHVNRCCTMNLNGVVLNYSCWGYDPVYKCLHLSGSYYFRTPIRETMIIHSTFKTFYIFKKLRGSGLTLDFHINNWGQNLVLTIYSFHLVFFSPFCPLIIWVSFYIIYPYLFPLLFGPFFVLQVLFPCLEGLFSVFLSSHESLASMVYTDQLVMPYHGEGANMSLSAC